MDRRTFLRSVIVGTLAAPFVTRGVKAEGWSYPASYSLTPVDASAACLCGETFHGIPMTCDRHVRSTGVGGIKRPVFWA